MAFTLTLELPESLWSCFIREHSQGNVFHTPEMFEVFRRTKNHNPEIWAVMEDGRILVLFLPVKVMLMHGVLAPITSRSISYGSVLCAPGKRGLEALAFLLDAYRQQTAGKPIYTELRNLSNLEDCQPVLRGHGFAYEDHLNYLVDLNHSPEDLFQSFGPRMRKCLRRALKHNTVTIEEATDRAGVAECYDIVRKSHHHAHIPIADPSLFEAAFDILHPRNMIRFTRARVKGRCCAASVELLYKKVIYGWYGGIDRNYNADNANELLEWNILKWGAESGYHVYDWGGAGRADTDYNVRDYKAKFGGELVCFGRNACIHSPRLLQIGKVAYSFLRPLF